MLPVGQPGSQATAGSSAARRKVVSLSHPLHPGIPQWPGDPPVRLDAHSRIESEGYFLRRITLGEHSGTHMNAPASFYPDGITIDQYEPESFIAQAVVLDMRRPSGEDPDYLLAVEEVESWERTYGAIAEGSVVLLHTGYQRYWNSPEKFLNPDPSGTAHFPGFGTEAARFLVEGRGTAGIGIDTHGVDGGMDTAFAVNRLILAEPRLVLENLANLDQLPPRGTTLIIAPLPLVGGSGAPVSVLAIVP